MKSEWKVLVAGLLVVAGFSFLKVKTAITGRVSPADGAEVVWVVSAKDSLKTGISEGQFYFDVKPGVYKLVVDAKEPYKDVLLENLAVKQDETLDVGEIILKQ